MGLLIIANVFITARAEDIGSAEAKGLLFKDKVVVSVFDDPTVGGISCYTTTYIRTMSLADDSSSSSLSCRRVGKITGTPSNQKNVFSQNKAFLSLYKTTVVDRFFDSKRNVLVYLSYTKSLGEGKNADTSVSVVPISE